MAFILAWNIHLRRLVLVRTANLAESEAKLRGLYELSPLGIALTDMKGRYVEYNDSFQRICGYTDKELKALDYWELTPRKYEAEEARQLESLTRTGRYGPYEKEYIHRDGSLVPLQLNGVLVNGRDGQKYIWSIVEDITERKRAEEELRIAAIAFESQDGMIVTDANAVIVRVNQAFTQLTGYRPEEVVGKTPAVLSSGRHGPEFYRRMWQLLQEKGYWQGEIWNRRKDGKIYAEWLTISAVVAPDGTKTHFVGTFTDITVNEEVEAEIHRLAYYDPLTQLPNRRLLQDRLEQAILSSRRSDHHGALLFLDLDDFKRLNDTRGHETGDQLLLETAQRMTNCVREGDTVARLGGDEFVIILEGLSETNQDAAKQAKQAKQAEQVADKVRAVLSQPYDLAGKNYHCTTSIGIALLHDHETTAEMLLKHADMALYKAKDAGRNCFRFFDPAMQIALEKHTALETELRLAVEREQLQLHYQVQVDVDGKIIGAEALLRWEHPDQGLVSPDNFIPLAEETGLIIPIGQWVLETACGQIETWSANPEMSQLQLAINVSARQFHQPEFVSQVEQVLSQTGANPELLKIELTESMVLEDIGDTLEKMRALKALGVALSLDDFGTGYSSLSYLTRLPLDQLKIDRSFVLNLPDNQDDVIVAQTIITMAQGLGLDVIAEGVETESQREFLSRHGCDAYQGYLFGRPIPLDEFEHSTRRDTLN
ncbi:MAG: EAL domain-containing protein [Sedimenticola sp.]